MTLPISQVRAWLGSPGQCIGGQAQGCSIDSRTVKLGELFFAIRGPSHDGHDFVDAALQRGAVAAVVDTAYRGKGPLVPVPDTALALQILAARARKAWGRTVVAVTGSSGKTTTKDTLAALLDGFLPVAKSEGNLNNEYGLPLSLLRVPDQASAAVVEIGINNVGEMRPLAEIAAPDVGVVTNVGAAHVGNFASVDKIAVEKGRLIEALPPTGTAVLNADDARVAAFRTKHAGPTVTYGIERNADVRGESVEQLGSDGVRFRVDGHVMTSALAGKHNIYNILAAVAAAGVLGIAPQRLAEAVSRLRPSAMRGIVRKVGGVTVIDDCYNANPAAMEAMLDVLRGTAATRRIAVLGEMRELGELSPELHRRVGAAVASAGVDYLVAVGGHAAEIASAAGIRSEFHESPAQAGIAVADLIGPGDAVLFKASRGVGLEQARDLVFDRLDAATPKQRRTA